MCDGLDELEGDRFDLNVFVFGIFQVALRQDERILLEQQRRHRRECDLQLVCDVEQLVGESVGDPVSHVFADQGVDLLDVFHFLLTVKDGVLWIKQARHEQNEVEVTGRRCEGDLTLSRKGLCSLK